MPRILSGQELRRSSTRRATDMTLSSWIGVGLVLGVLLIILYVLQVSP